MKKLKYLIIGLFVFFGFNISVKADMPTLTYSTHVENFGWMKSVSMGNTAGTSGKALRMEAIKINLSNAPVEGSITYQAHVENYGWMNPVTNGNVAGTSGKALRIEAIKINLTGELAETYDIYYQVHAENYGWLGWARNGEEAGTAGFALRLEAIRIVLVEKGANAPGSTLNHYHEKPIEVRYNTHVQNIGWTNYSANGATSGTSGKGLRLEAINIFLYSPRYSGGITYQTHIQDIGWSGWSSNGSMSGTSGQAKRLEAIRIKLTGDVANYYDIYYHTHVQYVGWTGWVKNGELSGTTGRALRLEAIEIKIVEKGGAAPYSDANFVWYYDGSTKVLINTVSGEIGRNVKKIIDVSEHNGQIDWDHVKRSADIDGAILRAGYGSSDTQIDGTVIYNASELERLGIPYGLYWFSYAENKDEAIAEANVFKKIITDNNLHPTLGLFYDIESWNLGYANSNGITKETYDEMINAFKNNLTGYNVGVYTGVNYAYQRLSEDIRSNINWIAQYNSTCQYKGTYDIWQYSSTGRLPGITTRVDMNVKFR